MTKLSYRPGVVRLRGQPTRMYTRFIGTGFAFFAILLILALAPLVATS